MMHQTSLRYIIIIEMLTADLSYCILVLSCLGWILTNTPDAVKIICHHSCLWCHLSWCHLSCIWCHLLPFMFVMSSFMMSSLMYMMSPVTIHVCDVIFHDVISHVCDVSCYHSWSWCHLSHVCDVICLMFVMSVVIIHVCDVLIHVCESSFRLLGKISNKR